LAKIKGDFSLHAIYLVLIADRKNKYVKLIFLSLKRMSGIGKLDSNEKSE